MTDASDYKSLTDTQRDLMIEQCCFAADWAQIRVETDFDPTRVRRVHFGGQVSIGSIDDDTPRAGLFDANIFDCEIGRNVRIANVGVRIANYTIGDGTVIEDVGLIETRPGATFGNGVRAEVLNEGGGRQVVLFNELSSQFAYLLCVHRYRPALIENLEAIADRYTAGVQSDVGSIGTGATLRCVKQMLDVNVGAAAVISGASSLINGTILSSVDAPTTIGTEVQCDDFIVAEGSSISGAAIISKTFVGQACRIGKQFSADRSLFFANSDALHGEAVCVFAGPFTVTHHKSTLLIAGLFSFFNAGSGTNQSNHKYKLGPLHEGKLERGTKTGSLSTLVWPCRVGPFSVVLGRHTRHFDTSMLPFSVLNGTATGRCDLRPGANLSSAGTQRDGGKWPTRDGREGSVTRDRISYEVFSPFTVGRMLEGAALLADLQRTAGSDDDTIEVHGADVLRARLREGEASYRTCVEMYLQDHVMRRAERAIETHRHVGAAFELASDAVDSTQWLDIGGMLMPRQRLDDLLDAVCEGAVADIDTFNASLDRIASTTENDQWAWVRRTYERVTGQSLNDVDNDDLICLAESLLRVRERFAERLLADARKEFADHARIGFGHDGTCDDAEADFIMVRGTFEDNPFVKTVMAELDALRDRVAKFKDRLAPSRPERT